MWFSELADIYSEQGISSCIFPTYFLFTFGFYNFLFSLRVLTVLFWDW